MNLIEEIDNYLEEGKITVSGSNAFDVKKALGKVKVGDKIIVNFINNIGKKDKATYIVNQVISNEELSVDAILSSQHKMAMTLKLVDNIVKAERR